MQQLHLVGFTADNRGLIFSPRKGSKSGGFVVTLDDKLVARVDEIVARREAEEEGARSSSAPRSSLSPREIQARLRAGRTIPQVAREAGVEEEWVARWAAPILAEQGQVVERAQELTLEKARVGVSAVPLGEAVRWNMADKGIVFTDAGWAGSWDAFHLRGNSWMVRFTYVYRRKTHQAEWEVDTRDATVISRNRQATELGFVAPGRRRPKMPRSTLTAVDLPSPPTVAGQEPAPAKRASKKRAAVRKPARKKPAAKKRPAKRPTAKKTATKKSLAKKSSARKPAAKKATSRRAPAKKSPARKSQPRNRLARGAATKKATTKKAATRKAPARKTTAKKAAPRKSTAKKAGARKAKPRPPAVTPSVAVPASRVVPTPSRVAPRPAALTPSPRPSAAPRSRATNRPRFSPTPSTPARRRPSSGTRRPEPRRPAEAASVSETPEPSERPAREMETLPRPQVRAPIRIDSGVPRRSESNGPPIIRADRADQSREEPVGVGGRSAEPASERQGRFRFRRGRGRT